MVGEDVDTVLDGEVNTAEHHNRKKRQAGGWAILQARKQVITITPPMNSKEESKYVTG